MTESTYAPRKLPRQQRSQRTVERILEAAAHIFDEVGYSETSTSDIASEAGVSIGSLYQYFPNKDSMLLALTQTHIESTTIKLSQMISGFDPNADLADVLRSLINFLVEQHELDRLHLLIAHTAPRTHEVGAALDQAKSHLVQLAASYLKPTNTETTNSLLTARMLVATIDAGVHDVILREPRGKARDRAIDLTVATAMSIVAIKI
jgi:AcrR family transcriptional regulator